MGILRSTTDGKTARVNQLPALALATQLVRATMTGACSTCETRLRPCLATVLTRMLLGWPMNAAGRAADIDFLHERATTAGSTKSSPATDQKDKDKACGIVVALQSLTPSMFSHALVWGRQEPWPAPLAAQLVLGADSCSSSNSGITTATQLSRDRCTLVTRLFQTGNRRCRR